MITAIAKGLIVFIEFAILGGVAFLGWWYCNK